MTQPRQSAIRNRLLAGLAPGDFGLIQPHLQPVALDLRDMILRAGQPIPHLTFIERGIASGLADTDEGRIEVGIIGREGLVGVPVLLGIGYSPHGYMVQAEGDGYRISSEDIRAAMGESPSLQARFLRYTHAVMVQTAQTAFANAGFTIEARLARWILMTHDRTDGDELLLTHEFLSMMLGVRRPGVTIAVQVLEGNGLIRALRGRIIVRDRRGLEALAKHAYELLETEHEDAAASDGQVLLSTFDRADGHQPYTIR